MIAYTTFLGVVVLYWLVVIIGFVGLDILDIDADMDVDVEADVPHAGGALHAILNFLNIGKVPLTIIISLMALKMWVFALIYNSILGGWAAGLFAGAAILFGIVAFLVFFFVSLFLTGMSTAPLKKLFEIHTTTGGAELLGMDCVVKSSKVTSSFGQAEIQINNSFMLLSVRCDEENQLSKGDTAVVASYDAEKNIYQVVTI